MAKLKINNKDAFGKYRCIRCGCRYKKRSCNGLCPPCENNYKRLQSKLGEANF